MSNFWSDKHRLSILKSCSLAIVDEVNQCPSTRKIAMFVSKIPNGSLCMEVFNGETFQSKCRFSGLPQPQANIARNDSTALDYDDMAPIKQRIVSLVDLSIGKNIHFERILTSLQQPKRQWWSSK
jgi:hypothetical protein